MGEDNPTFEGLFEFCSISAGGSIGASTIMIFVPLPCLIPSMQNRCFSADSLGRSGYCD